MAVVDDNASVRESIGKVLTTMGIESLAYGTAKEFLDDVVGRRRCGCVILDVRLPDMSGLELQQVLLRQRQVPAIVFISGHGDIAMAVQAIRAGATDFLVKPFSMQHLLDSVQRAQATQAQMRRSTDARESVDARMNSLTPREREVLAGLLRGLRTKQISVELGIAVKTVDEHRGRVMRKMQVETIGALVALCVTPP